MGLCLEPAAVPGCSPWQGSSWRWCWRRWPWLQEAQACSQATRHKPQSPPGDSCRRVFLWLIRVLDVRGRQPRPKGESGRGDLEDSPGKCGVLEGWGLSPGEGRVWSASCGHSTPRSRAGSEVLAHAPPGGRFLWPQGAQGPAGRGNLAAPSSYRERSGIPEALPARGPGEPVQSCTGPDPLPSASPHPTPRSQGLIKASSPGTPLHPTLLCGYPGRERPKGLIWTREWKPREGRHPGLWQERMLPGACSGSV